MALMYDEPKGNLPLISNPESTLDFSQVELSTDKVYRVLYWGYLMELAYQNPGQTQKKYFEENNYEYEIKVTWNPDTKTMVTNRPVCPNKHLHHIGTTCNVCGLKD